MCTRKKVEMRSYDENMALKIILQATEECDVRPKDKHFLIAYRGKRHGNALCWLSSKTFFASDGS